MLQHHFADLKSIKLHYVSAGEGELLLFVHGFPEFWYEWKNQLNEFGRDYHAVAPDMRGYNLSSKPPNVEEYRVKALVEDLRQFALHLGAERFTLIAHDWGGAVAWAFALAHPEMLRKLVIINAPHPGVFARELKENPAQQKASQYMLMFRTPEAEGILSADNYAVLVRMVLGEGFTEEDKRLYIEAWSQPGALTGGLNYYRAARIGPPTEGEKRSDNFAVDPAALVVKVPTLVIWGEKDIALLPGNLDGLEAYVPELLVRRIPDGSHWVVHEKPELVNRYIREFISAPR